MSNTQVILCLFALLLIHALAATLDAQDEHSALRPAARVKVACCMHAATRHDALIPAAASTPTAVQPVC